MVVIGAGQAGLSTSFHLQRRGLVPGRDFLVLDANPGPGGAWQHRWESLTLGNTHRIHDLPGTPLGEVDPHVPARKVVSEYYQRYEETLELDVRRPVRVQKVTSPEGPQGRLQVESDQGTWHARTLVNATGTWDQPHWPHYPGREDFTGRQLHTHDFVRAEEFTGLEVIVVGGGTSAVQFLLQLAKNGARTQWFTRTAPRWTRQAFDAHWGREVERRVTERVEAGLPPVSVVSATGLPLTPEYQHGIEAGILTAQEMFTRITPGGVLLSDGSEQAADVILWATGFRPALRHLQGLGLRSSNGGIALTGTTVAQDPRIQLAGYGPGASTLGATRTGRTAALAALAFLEKHAP